MASCASCGGSGKWRCTSCHGRGYISRLTVSGDMDMSPCAVCGGRRQVPCQFCGGRGQVGSPSHHASSGSPPPRKRRALEDVLEGRWNGPQGSWLEFTRQGRGYRVTEGGPLGRTGQGTATLHGQAVSLESTNMVLGPYRLDLRLVNDQLIGQLNVMGFPMPLTLSRG